MYDREESGTVVIPSLGAKEKESGEKPPGEACIILLHPPGPNLGRRTLLDRSRYVIGRDGEADLLIGRDSVSRRHAEILREPDGHWVVQDLGSTNGTFVNDSRVGRGPLRDGDQVRFGDTIFKFLSGENVEADYHEEIYRMTILDGLTGVHNHRYFYDFLDREVAAAHRHCTPLTLVLFDIDHFKPINDDRGHLCGDSVLKELAARVRARIRREDLFARYGGEEFACVLTQTPLQGGVRFAEAVRTIIERDPFRFDGDAFPVTVSVGVASILDEPDVTTDGFIKRADENLYAAKNSGRNRVVPAPPEHR